MDNKIVTIFLSFGFLISLTRGQTNVALVSQGSRCESSQQNCEHAFDGVSASTSIINRWDFFGDAQLTWIKVTFNQTYTIYTARFMQLAYADESNFKDLELTFEDGTQQQVTLTVRETGFQWEEFTLNPPVETTFVDVLILTAYTTGRTYNGFSEIEFYEGLLTTSTAQNTTTTPETTLSTTSTPDTTTTIEILTDTTTSTVVRTTTVTTTNAPTETTTTPAPTTESTTPQITSSPAPDTTTSVSTEEPVVSTEPASSSSVSASSSSSSATDSSTSADSTSPPVPSTDGPAVSTTTTISTPTVTTEKDGLTRELLVAVIISAIFGLLLIIVCLVLVIKVCCRSKGSKKDKDPDTLMYPVSPSNGVRPHSLDYDSLATTTETPVSTLPPSSSSHTHIPTESVPSRPIQVPNLGQAIITLAQDDGFGDEFREIPSGETGKITAGKRETNIKKNRFRNIFPFDPNRVQLSRLDDSDDTDYVNASFIKGYDNGETFIAAQGPNKLSIPDYWRMIWEQNCAQMVMVTNLYEKGRQKCDQYWPDDGSEKYGLIDVKIVREERFPGYIIRELQMTKGSESKQVQQYHYTSWPDEGVPDTCTDVLAMIERVKAQSLPDKGPIVVHCSAGVGRTGTYIALSNLYKQAQAEGHIDVFKCVHLLRSQRMNMVQSLAQYRFIYVAMIEWLECKHVSTPCDDFPAVYPLIVKDTEGETSILEKQFQILDVFIPRDYKESCDAAAGNDNKDKNRDMDILPSDNVRPILSPVDGRSNYINAVFTKGYKKPFAQLVTQMPLENTVIEFWRMVSDFKVQAIVMLNSPLQDEQPYWPTEEGQTVELEDLFILKNDGVATVGNITITDVFVTNKDIFCEEAVLVKHFRLTESPTEDELPSEQSLLDLYHTVATWLRSGEDNRVAVHCLKGFERSGLFCGTHHIVEKINNEQEVDVFNAVKQARQGRPQLVPDLQQYRHLYKVAEVYLQMFDSYSNFKLPELEDGEGSEAQESPYINVSSLGSIVEEESEGEPEENNNNEGEEKEEPEEEPEEDGGTSVHKLIIEVD